MAEFKVSTNIVRDSALELDYIVTRNANEVFSRIIHNSSKGHRSFTIIGSYGTGKSTFLWAFEKHLTGSVKFDVTLGNKFKNIKKFDFVRVVGDSTSFKAKFCEVFGLSKFVEGSNQTILKEFDALYQDIAQKKTALVFLVDEFGKHLEYIAKNKPEEMYFIQELAEYCNDSQKNIFFITTLHQNFSVYSKGLNKAEKSEWDKVRGRLMDIAFDEPVEQLLFFAAQKLKTVSVPNKLKGKYHKTVEQILSSNLLGKTLASKEGMLEELYPLDPLAADILTKTLQRYGQNERSLFTFLESPEIIEAQVTERFFTVANCFDYLLKNLNSEIEDGEKNPFKPQWKAAIVALEKAEFIFDDDYIEASNIIKTICLVNIFSNASGKLDDAVLINYATVVLKGNNSKKVLSTLVDKKIIKFSKHRGKYNFLEGTDVDVEQELINAAKHIDGEIEIVSRLKSYFDFGIVPAKRVQFLRGTPRFFEFQFWDEFGFNYPTKEMDGGINLIFTKSRIESDVIDQSVNIKNQIFVLFKEVDKIKEVLLEVDKINYVIEKHSDDKVAVRILNEERLYQTNRLKYFVEDALFDGSALVTWIWNGSKDRKPKNARDLNSFLSDIAEASYPSVPVYRNEMVNKEYLSTPILTARKALIRSLINNGTAKDLGFPEDRFPPEKTIYYSLLKDTGIHFKDVLGYHYQEPTEDSFKALWKKTEEILESSINSKIPITKFYEELKGGEFKLKQGFLDFWIPIFLIIKKEDYSLYGKENDYVPHLTPDVMDIIHKTPEKYFVKGLSSKGVNAEYLSFYKDLTGFNESNVVGLESSYITIYGNFLRFYRQLEDYAKRTKQIPQSAVALREAIAKAKDPESALFDQIPTALGYFKVDEKKGLSTAFLNDLKLNIKHLRSAYDGLVDSIENVVISHLDIEVSGFDEFKENISSIYKNVNPNLIVNDQLRLFFIRVVSPLDVKRAYWESLCDATIGKKLDNITDDEVPVLMDRIKNNFDTLLDMVELHELDVSEEKEVVQISILSRGGDKEIKKNIVVSSDDSKELESLEEKLVKVLGKNADLNKIALLKLLEKELKK